MRRIAHWGKIAIVKCPTALRRLGENSTHAIVEIPASRTLKGVRLDTIYTGLSGTFEDCVKYVNERYGIDYNPKWSELEYTEEKRKRHEKRMMKIFNR